MGIELKKKTGINLKKGSSISLEKKQKPFTRLSIGLNWGAIPRTGFLSSIMPDKNVDLDGSVAMFSASGKVIDVVCYRKLRSNDLAIKHSGDDLTGDTRGDDGMDNETINITLSRVDKKVQTIVFFLNSYKMQDFASIPYSKIRIYDENNAIFATFNLSAEEKYANHVSMVMGKIVRNSHKSWTFDAIGEAVSSKDLESTVKLIKNVYV